MQTAYRTVMQTGVSSALRGARMGSPFMATTSSSMTSNTWNTAAMATTGARFLSTTSAVHQPSSSLLQQQQQLQHQQRSLHTSSVLNKVKMFDLDIAAEYENLTEEEKQYVPAPPQHMGERRMPALAEKIGMTTVFDEFGRVHGVTVLRIHDCYVVHHHPEPVKKGHLDLVKVTLGAGYRKPWKTLPWQMRLFERAGVEPRQHLRDVYVTPDMVLPVGTRLTARHFVPGQFVDVQGKTKGKGFAGVMKRWNFSGQRASHGVSKTHRHLGSTGASQNPGKVWKGKKMPGRMGGKWKTTENLRIYKIDPRRNLLFVLGMVSGPRGGFTRVRDAYKKKFMIPEDTPPFPQFIADPNEDVSKLEDQVMTLREEDPFLQGLEAA